MALKENLFFCTDSLEMKRLGIDMTANYTVKAFKEVIGNVTIIVLIEVNEIGLFNSEIFIDDNGEKRHFDNLANFNNINNCINKTIDFVNNLEYA